MKYIIVITLVLCSFTTGAIISTVNSQTERPIYRYESYPGLIILDVCPNPDDCSLESKVTIINNQVRSFGIEDFVIIYPDALYNTNEPVIIKVYYEKLNVEEREDLLILPPDIRIEGEK